MLFSSIFLQDIFRLKGEMLNLQSEMESTNERLEKMRPARKFLKKHEDENYIDYYIDYYIDLNE